MSQRKLTVGQIRRYDAIADAEVARQARARAASSARRARQKGVDVANCDLRSERTRWADWLTRGADLNSVHSLLWNTAGRCQRPITLHRTVRGAWSKGTYSMLSELEVRCRNCEACKKMHAREWAARAMKEMCAAPGRNWFVTLTFNAKSRVEIVYRASRKARLRCSGDLDAMPDAERFRRLHRIAGAVVTKYLKRLRKGGYKFRYLMVPEAHKDGFVHYHMLVHETDAAGPIPHSVLREQWFNEGIGFMHAKLVPIDGVQRFAWYAAKYLTKRVRARVRASASYGETR